MSQHFPVHPHGLGILDTPLNDAVADARKPQVATLFPQENAQMLDCPFVTKLHSVTPGLFVHHPSGRILCGKVRCCEKCFYLAAKGGCQPATFGVEYREFDARRAGVYDQYRISHNSPKGLSRLARVSRG